MNDIVRFENPNMLYLLLLLLPMVGYYIFKTKSGRATITFSSVKGLTSIPKSFKYYFRHIPFVLRCAALSLLIVATARPQSVQDSQTITSEGIDIVLSLDVSSSMLALDFSPNRLAAAKDVATKFILDRANDRLGLVVFAGESYTQSPLTSDQATVINLLNQVESGSIDDGTAIGSGLATAVNRLRESEAKSKVIILLTDGVNNMGQITPITAAETAKAFGIKVYTIGVGTKGNARYPATDYFGNKTYVNVPVEIDEKSLREIAKTTGGRYFRATDNQSLSSIYSEINKLEKSKVEVENFALYSEKYSIFVVLALIILMVEIAVRHLYLRQIP